MDFKNKLKELNDDALYSLANNYDEGNKEVVLAELGLTSVTDEEWKDLSEEISLEIEARQDAFVPEDTGEKDYTKPEAWYWFTYSLAELEQFDALDSKLFMKKFDIEDDDQYIAAKTSLKLAIQHYKTNESN